MKELLPVGKLKYFAYLMMSIQGVLLFVMAHFFLGDAYLREWQKYPHHKEMIHLKNLSEEVETATASYLFRFAEKEHLFLVRIDSTTKNGNFSGYSVGVWGDVQQGKGDFSFFDQKVLDEKKLQTLLQAEKSESTLGLAEGSIHQVGPLFNLRFSPKVVVKQLPQLIKENKINGDYRIAGLTSPQKKAELLNGLTKVTRKKQADLLTQTDGRALLVDLKQTLLLICLVFELFALLTILIVMAVKTLNLLGKLILLGWSRSAVVFSLFRPFVVASIALIPFFLFFSWYFFEEVAFLSSLESLFLLVGGFNVGLVLFLCFLASTVLLAICPIDAIKKRIPRKVLYTFGMVAYLLTSSGMMGATLYVDGSCKELINNIRLYKNWQKVAGYRIFERVDFQGNLDAFRKGSDGFNQKFFNWYQAIAEKKGVFLINTNYYSDKQIREMKKEETVAPEHAFWEYRVSPNYLPEMSLTIDPQWIQKAKEGSRLFLLPRTLKGNERLKMINYLKKSTLSGISDADIPTVFNQKKEFQFVDYQPKKASFTWTIHSDEEPVTVKDPVINVITPQNMTYFESESLAASGGLQNSYLKFADEKSFREVTTEKFLSRFGLIKKCLFFETVETHIDGYQKTLLETLEVFGGLLLFLSIIIIVILLVLASVFRMANYEKINIKKFLGFGYWQTYLIPVSLLTGAVGLEFLIISLFRCKSGMLLTGVMGIFQLFVLWKYMTRYEMKNLVTDFKE